MDQIKVEILFERPAKDGEEIKYRCNNSECDNMMECDMVSGMETELEMMIEICDGADEDMVQSLLDTWSSKFHSNHYLILLLKRKLLSVLKLKMTTEPDRDLLTR